MIVLSSLVTPTTPTFPETLKEIINQEPSSSPRALRNIASKLSISGRNKFPQQGKELVVLGRVKNRVASKASATVEELEKLPEASGSMSERRGFRTLSIHTGKAFEPFGLVESPKSSPRNTRAGANCHDTVKADFATLISSTRKPCLLLSPIITLTTCSS